MNDESRYVRVGAFVFAGIGLAVALVVIFGGGSLFRQPLIVETVFEESVQGLEVGSPVKLRGVKLGTVSYIGFVGDNYLLEGEDLAKDNLVLVRMAIEPPGGETRTRVEQDDAWQALVDQGLRLRLTPLGITGTSFIQADFLDAGKNPPMKISWTPSYMYVPSAASTIAQLSSAAERLMTRIDALDVERLLTNFDKLLVSLNTSLGEADVEGARKSVGELLADLRKTSEEAREAIASVDARGIGKDARAAMDQLGATLVRVQRLLDSNTDDLAVLLDNLRVASENLREASETARAYPSYLLFGAPPKAVEAPAK